MRHYLRVDHDGMIIGSSTYPSGFPAECDLSDPNNFHPVVVRHREMEAKDPAFDRYMAYDCPCLSEVVHCRCVYDRKAEVFVEDGVIQEKPGLIVMLDGAPAAAAITNEPLLMTPGSSVALKLVAAVQDGHTITISSRGPASLIATTPMDLTFTGGETEEVILYAPAFGVEGWVSGISKYVRPFRVLMKGWSA